jgi:hypothetical protein
MDAYMETKDKGLLFVIRMNQSLCVVKKYVCWFLAFKTIKKGYIKTCT